MTSIILKVKYRQLNTNKYSILINKSSLIKSLNNAKYELNGLLNNLYNEKGTFKYKFMKDIYNKDIIELFFS